MKKFIHDYFNFSNRERKGFIVLVTAIFLCLIVPRIYLRFKVDKVYDYSDFEAKIDAFLVGQEQQKTADSLRSYFTFDPNTATIDNFKQLGFSENQTKNIVNYRNAGGKFKEPTDISRIYSLDPEFVKTILPYVKIVKYEKQRHYSDHKKYVYSSSPKPKITEKTKLNIEINTADSLQLISLKGIGPIFASRIINYRKSLGGFWSIGQLSEVYGLKPEIVDVISKNCFVDTNLITKLDLNHAEFNQVLHHPYLNYKQTKAIFQYLAVMGNIQSPECLINNHLLDSVTYYKILPYILITNKN